MKRIIAATSIIFLTTIICFAQCPVDIAGRGNLTKRKAHFFDPDFYTLTITQTAEQLKLVKTIIRNGRSQTTETILYVDGRGEKNEEVESKTIVKKDYIYRKKEFNGLKQHEKYYLSKDSKNRKIFYSVKTAKPGDVERLTASAQYHELTK